MRVEGIGQNMRIVVVVGTGKIAVGMRNARMMMTLRVILVEGWVLKLEAWDAEGTGLGKIGACTWPEPPDSCCCCTKRKDAGCTPPLNSCDASVPALAASLPTRYASIPNS